MGQSSDYLSPNFQLGLLNSILFNWIHHIKYYSARIPQGSLRYPISFLEQLPILRNEIIEKRIEELVDRLNSNKENRNAEQIQIQNEIDAWVFILYNLNESEMELILKEQQIREKIQTSILEYYQSKNKKMAT